MSKQAKQLAAVALVMGAAGYIAGILTAPKSGKETRQDIKNTAIKTKIEVEKRLKNLYSELLELTARAKEVAATSKAKVREEIEVAVRNAQQAKQKVRGVLSAIHEGEVSDEDLDIAIKEAKDAAKHLKVYLKKND